MIDYRNHKIVPSFTQYRARGKREKPLYLYGVEGKFPKSFTSTPLLTTIKEAQDWIDTQLIAARAAAEVDVLDKAIAESGLRKKEG